MSTSLAAQLQKLALPSTDLLKSDKKRISLLFDPKEAASISGEVIFEIGKEGLEQLINKNEDFAQFRQSLYHISSKDFDRNVQNKEDNKKLDKSVKKFLIMLAPYILTNSAHKALEWLFYRYLIHEYSRNELIICALPYYSSNIFARIIQTLKFKDTNDPYHFLKTVKKSGMHLPRLDLFYQALSNLSIIKNLTKFMDELLTVHKNYSSLSVQFNFYSSVFCGAIEFSNELTEPLISQMLPLILKGLKSAIPDFAAASYVITARLLSKGALNDKLLNVFVEKVSDLKCNSLKLESSLLLVLIYQLQPQYKDLPDEALGHLTSANWLIECMSYLHTNGNCVYPFMKVLLKQTVQKAVEDDGAPSRSLVLKITDDINMEAYFIKDFLSIIIKATKHKKILSDPINEWLTQIIRNLELKDKSQLDLAVAEILKTDSKKSSEKTFLKNLLSSLNETYATKFKILNDIYANEESLDEEKLKNVSASINELNVSDKYLLSNALCEKLNSKTPKIVEKTLELMLSMNVGDSALLNLHLMGFFSSEKMKLDKWHKVINLAVKFLLKDQEFDWHVFITILPYFARCSKKQFQELLKFKFFAIFKLFKGLKLHESEDLFSQLLSYIERNADMDSLESFLNTATSSQDTSVTFQYSSLIIISAFNQNLSPLSETMINKVFSLFNACRCQKISTDICESSADYYDIALKNRIPLKSLQGGIEKIIKKTFNAQDDFSRIDLTKYSVVLRNLCALAFEVTGLKFMYDDFLHHVATDKVRKEIVSLNICCSGILTDEIIINILNHHVEEGIGKECETNTFFPVYLMMLLQRPNDNIRQLTFNLMSKSPQANKDSKLSYLVKLLLKYKEEISTDHEQVSLTCCHVLPENLLIELLKIVCSDDTSMYVKAGVLTILSHKNNYDISEKLCEYFLKFFRSLDLINGDVMVNLISRFNLAVMQQLHLESHTWKMILFILNYKKTLTIDGETRFLPSLLLNQFSKDVYAVLSEDILGELLDSVCEASVLSVDPEISSLGSKIIKHIDLNAKVICGLLRGMCEVQSSRTVSRPGKSARRAHVVPTVDILDTLPWKKGICMLEFIQGKKKIKCSTLLLPLLFDILKRCLDFEEQAAVEYPKQLTLALILLVCSKLEEETLSEKDFNIELVIQCIRASQNPQTHYHALLALAHAAKHVPNEVLHHVMAVFTFMGSTLIRHDDVYSFEIIAKIVDTIIPILVSKSQQTTIADVIRVFVGALLDVPEHRRIPLYSKLLSNIDSKKNFHLFLLLVLEAEIFQNTRDKKKIEKGSLSTRIKIALKLCQEFSAEITLNACDMISQYINELPDEQEELNMKKDTGSINLNNFNPKQFRHFKYLIITFLSNLLSSPSFVNNIALLPQKENINMEPLYKELIINVLSYIQRVQKVSEKSVNSPQALYWKTLLHHSYDLLDSINCLLTPQMFLLVIKGLLVHSLHTVKKRSLELLNNKLQYNISSFNEKDKTALYILIQPIFHIVESIEQDNLQPDQEILIQTALLSLKLIVKTLGPDEPEKFVQILDFVASILNSGKAKDNVLASVILCLAELCVVLRGHAIVSLSAFMPSFLSVLKRQKYQEISSMLLLSVITAMNKLLESFAAFLSPYLKKMVCETSILISKWNTSSVDPKSQALVVRLNSIKKKLSQVIEPRILIPIIEDCYDNLVNKKYYKALVALVDIMEEQLSGLSFNEISPNINELTSFFLKTLQFRSDNTHVNLEVATLVEQQAVKTLTVFILKLSESTFRPFFLKLYDWAIRAKGSKDRLITFYHLSQSVGHSLKGLFSLFAGNILSNLAEILRSFHTDEPVFDSLDKSVLLLEHILQTLLVVCTYDNKKLINRDRFDLLMQPLIDLLEKDIDGIDNLIVRNQRLITPTIVAFSMAIADDALWKSMNYQILLKMRNADADIRLVALYCLSEVVSKLREDFLPLLPETIPFLAELLEDEDERVEKSCQTTIREMEKVLGEPLQKYF